MIIGAFLLVLLYLLPGYAASRLVFPARRFLDRVILSIGLSILLNVSFGLVLVLLKSFTPTNIILADLAFCAAAVLYDPRKRVFAPPKLSVQDIRDARVTYSELQTWIVLAGLCLFIFLIIYDVRASYSGLYQNPNDPRQYIRAEGMRFDYPIHADEWSHLARVRELMSTNRLAVNPYLPQISHIVNLEPGFHIFLAEHYMLSGMDPVLGYKYLPALFAVITALYMFLLSREIFHSEYVGYLSILFLSAIKSNINLMGLWFFTPQTMSFFLLLMFLIISVEAGRNRISRSQAALLAYLALAALIIYPPVFFILCAFSLSYLGLYSGYLKPRTILSITILALATFFLLSLIFPHIRLIFSASWTKTNVGTVRFNLLQLAGLGSIAFAILGLLYASKVKSGIILHTYLFLCAINLILLYFLDYTILIPYQRVIYYLLLSLVPLSAAGLYKTLNVIRDKAVYSGLGHVLTKVLLLLILSAVIYYNFINYYDIDNQEGISNVPSKNLVVMYPVDAPAYDAIDYIGRNFGPAHVVLANNLVSFGLYPISGNHVVGIQGANLGGGDPSLYQRFISGDCSAKQNIIRSADISYIITEYTISCSNIVKIYGNTRYNVYRVL